MPDLREKDIAGSGFAIGYTVHPDLGGDDYQDKLARFMENHDEPRAAATFAPGMHEAAAILTYLTPGLRFFHQGRFDGRRTRISAVFVEAEGYVFPRCARAERTTILPRSWAALRVDEKANL